MSSRKDRDPETEIVVSLPTAELAANFKTWFCQEGEQEFNTYIDLRLNMYLALRYKVDGNKITIVEIARQEMDGCGLQEMEMDDATKLLALRASIRALLGDRKALDPWLPPGWKRTPTGWSHAETRAWVGVPINPRKGGVPWQVMIDEATVLEGKSTQGIFAAMEDAIRKAKEVSDD